MKFLHLRCVFVLVLSMFEITLNAQYVLPENNHNGFCVYTQKSATSLLLDEKDFPGVIRAAKDLQNDVEQVTDTKPELVFINTGNKKNIIIVGSIGKSKWIDQLIRENKIDVKDVSGKWETFLIQSIKKPFPGIDEALIIAGSDKRGTIFGIYELSRQIGVSPWYWWADVPPQKRNSIFFKPGRFVQGEPEVKYRGIFINDEEPSLGRWAVEKYGGFNHEFYSKVFELILRMKGNYLWPAMWWASFSSDDPQNAKLADDYGIVIGTTHHEPMMRAHAEWKTANGGAWNYATNETTLKKFWTEGIQRMNGYETIVSLGMRGDGDMAMTEDTNIALLERIVKDQRNIIQSVTGKDIQKTPQLWALYKEVQDYYDKGMRVPDDVTLLLCDDNWGNIRKLPAMKDSARAGGYGIYYHFDYVGGPRNYKWINTNPIARVWEQMNLAYQYRATKIWLVNVGDIKPMEFPITFFLDYAWNPAKWNQGNLQAYTVQWATEHFGEKNSVVIADIISAYTKFNGRRKPELLNSETYSLTNYREAELVTNEYNKLAEAAEKIYQQTDQKYKDAFYQLVLHPVKASANLQNLYYTVAKNHLYAKQKRSATNALAAEAHILFKEDAAISNYYNNVMAGGKWKHMMDQTHISYTYWQQPAKDVMPEVDSIDIQKEAMMGVAVEGSENSWPQDQTEMTLPPFDNFNKQQRFIEIFNQGTEPFEFTILAKEPFIISQAKGIVKDEQRIQISIDWKKIKSSGVTRMPITIKGAGKSTTIFAVIHSNEIKNFKGYIESEGFISVNPVRYSSIKNTAGAAWTILPDHGKTSSAITTFPVTATETLPDANSPLAEYQFYTVHKGDINIQAYFSPTLNFNASAGLRYAISIDNEAPQIISLHEDKSLPAWEKSVADNIIIKITKHNLSQPGKHTLKFWRVDPGVILQKIVVETEKIKPSYLGPPESFYQYK